MRRSPQYCICSILKIIVLYIVQYCTGRVKNDQFHKGSVAQVVEYWNIVLKKAGSSPPGVFGDAAAEFAEFNMA